MELIDVIPEFNLYEEFWKIYTKSDAVPPQYISADSRIERSIITGGSEIYGDVYNSVIGSGVTIGKGTVVRDSIIMKNTTIGENCTIEKAIIAEDVYKRQILCSPGTPRRYSSAGTPFRIRRKEAWASSS